jgi:hypothetical protein
LGHTLTTIVDKPKKNNLQWCNVTVNDKRLGNSRTHVMNIFEIQISYLCSLSRCLQIFHIIYIGGEHKAHVVQVNSKKEKIEKIKFII